MTKVYILVQEHRANGSKILAVFSENPSKETIEKAVSQFGTKVEDSDFWMNEYLEVFEVLNSDTLIVEQQGDLP